MASLIAFDLLRFEPAAERQDALDFSVASSVDYDDAVHAVCTHANQGMIKSTAKPYIVVGEGMCPAAACRSCPMCANDARDRLQTVRPTRAFDPQAYCPPRWAAGPSPSRGCAPPKSAATAACRQPRAYVVVSTH